MRMNKNTQMIGNMNEAKNVEAYLRKRALPKTIYIIAPTRRDFMDWCTLRGIHFNNPKVNMIDHCEKIIGREIQPQDEVVYLNKEGFEPEMLKEIELQVKMRTRIDDK
jgi:hypothetical protein